MADDKKTKPVGGTPGGMGEKVKTGLAALMQALEEMGKPIERKGKPGGTQGHPSDTDEQKATKIRNKRDAGDTLTASEEAWLANYEG